MENIDFATLFQGIGTMMESGWLLASARGFLGSKLSGTSGVVTYLSRVEGSARAYGHDPDGARHGSYQLRNIDDAGWHIRQPFSRPDAFGYG